MKIHSRIFILFAVVALVSGSALVVRAQNQDQPQNQDQDQYQVQSQDRDQAPPDQGQYQDQAQDRDQVRQDQGQVSEDQMSEDQGPPPPPNGQALPADPQNDPPSRAARLQFTEGSVSVQPHGTDDWVTGDINRPLTNSDNVWADKNSRAEINVGTGLIRIDSESSLTLTNIGENTVQLQLHQGAMNLHVRRLYDGEAYEVDTPNQSFTVLKPGDYRFDVNPDADKTVITVWRGEGESAGDGPAVRIRQNEQARFTDGTSMKNQIHAAPLPDGFDEWAESRDGRVDRSASASARYVSPDVVGSEDLDEYGTWHDSPEYGNVWVPSRVDAGWAPYRNGHWIWVAPWGWTWVEDEPWGYAPFHYGRWVYYDNYWGWAPGPIYARPYYSPALVAFYGGGGWGVGFGFGGGYGWCPLGFGEPFIPWYGVSRGYFNRVNITNTRITNINNVYNTRYINRGSVHGSEPVRLANMRAPNGFTAVSRDTMVNSRSVARNNVRISPNAVSRMSPSRTLDIRPTRTTMLGANAGRSAAVPPSRSFSRPVVSRNNDGAFHGGSATMPSRGVGRNNVNSNMRPDRGSAMSRSVPRPPNAGGTYADRYNGGRANQSRADGSNQNRPNQITDRGNSRPYSQGSVPRPESAPRPSPGYTPRNESSNPRGNSAPPRANGNSNERSGGPRSELRTPPSPYGAPRGYSSAADRRSYSSPGPRNDRASYGGGSYGGRQLSERAYSRPSQSYGGGSYSRSAPAPSYARGGSYGRSAPSYNAPSYSRAPSARSAPAYSGGGRSGGSYGGGRPSSGGRASAPSRSSGGGGNSRGDSRGRR